MKILFICGCLESGKDGVGDYVHTLGKELSSQHNQVTILALNDPFVSENKEELREGIAILRLEANSSWSTRINKSKAWIDKKDPDHINWQFVLYAYHSKGLPVRAIYLITDLLKNYRNVSLMLHELWIGAAREDSYLNKCTGKIQKLLISWMISNLNPAKTFTSNIIYESLLKKMGVQSVVLPLFSNIPFMPDGLALFKQFLLQQKIHVPENSVKIGHFGRIPFSWQSQQLFHELRKAEIPVVLFIAGRSDQMKATELEYEFKTQVPLVKVIIIGEQQSDLISGFLQYIDFGISFNAPQILDKSGVFAAFKEHGLPTILAGIEKHYFQVNPEANHRKSIKLDLNGLAQKIGSRRRSTPRNTCREISRVFLQSLEEKGRKESKVLIEV